MLPSVPRGRILRMTLLVFALLGAVMFLFRSFGTTKSTVQGAEQDLAKAEREREAAAVRAAVVVARAAEVRANARPALARAEIFHSRVRVERTGQLRVQDSAASEGTIVPVPPLVTERIQADSAAINALSLALLWDTRAADAQEERLGAELKVRDASRLTIATLKDERRPRCGRRCGIVLGAASVVALSLAIDQTRRLLHN
jgi:hypothetical protein